MKARRSSLSPSVVPASLLALSLLSACDSAPPADLSAGAQAVGGPSVTIDPRRSLAVTEEPLLTGFSLERVMNQLASQSGVAGLTGLDLFQQWWDTQNPAPGTRPGPHCDDVRDPVTGTGVINGFPYTCRPAPSEGGQASVNPFTSPATNPDTYIPIGLFNRFDLAPPDGGHCGEYRIVYGKRSGITATDQRNLVIFEATLPNPKPADGLEGCRAIVAFWAELSKLSNLSVRRERLEQLYFSGLVGVPPVVHVDNFGSQPRGGQIRTNQFINALPVVGARVWSLREFRLVRSCSGGSCTKPVFQPVSTKVNPFGPLFATGAASHALTSEFQDFFVSAVPKLVGDDLGAIDFPVPDKFNTAQSQSSGSDENRYALQFAQDLGSGFRARVAAAIAAAGSTLTPEQVVLRAQALSCAGCHKLNDATVVGPNGQTWPSSLSFVHVSERDTEVVGGVKRFKISPALANDFLPRRKTVMERFLNGLVGPPSKGPTIGGRRTH
jgi:hypothetical protein